MILSLGKGIQIFSLYIDMKHVHTCISKGLTFTKWIEVGIVIKSESIFIMTMA